MQAATEQGLQAGSDTEVEDADAGAATIRSVRHVPRHLPALDGLRGIAVLYVFLYHYGGGQHAHNILLRGIGFACSVGWTGVTLFFLLSGFLITGLLWDAKGEPHWFRNFYLRRALRIWPLYYGTLFLVLLWPLLDHRYDFHKVAGAVLIHAAYLQNVPTYNWRVKQVNLPFWLEHYWTLAVEEQFYLLWPMLLFFMKTRRQALWLCVGTIAFSILFVAYNQTTVLPSALWHSLPDHAGELALGAALALSFRDPVWLLVKRWIQGLGIAGAVAFFAGTTLLSSRMGAFWFEHSWGQLAASLACAGLLVSVLEPGPWARAGSMRWLRWIGGISFGMYVIHLLLVPWFNELTHWLTGRQNGDWAFDLVRLVVALPLTLALAALSFRFYERPFLRFKERFAARRSPRLTVASQSSGGRY